MNKKTATPKAAKPSKIKKIQQLYGPDAGGATLEQTSAWLKEKGFTALGDLLLPAK